MATPDAKPDAKPDATTGTANAQAHPQPIRRPAGVAQKGGPKGGQQNLPPAGPVTVPLGTLFSLRDRIAFEILIPKTLQDHLEKTGERPDDQQQFMKDIIAAYHIRLPALPAGHRYVYDPVKHDLTVVKDAGHKEAARNP